MTTYGTIPAITQPQSNLQLNISRAKERIKAGLGTRKPWKEMIQPHNLTLPSSFNQITQRIKTNIFYFHVNYAIIVLFILFLSLLWHPISLIVFIVMMAAWLFLYFLRDDALIVFGRVIDDKMVLIGLSLMTIFVLYFTDVKNNLIGSLSFGLGVVIVHGAMRTIEDLFIDNEEGHGLVSGNVKVPLKTAASSSYCLS